MSKRELLLQLPSGALKEVANWLAFTHERFRDRSGWVKTVYADEIARSIGLQDVETLVNEVQANSDSYFAESLLIRLFGLPPKADMLQLSKAELRSLLQDLEDQGRVDALWRSWSAGELRDYLIRKLSALEIAKLIGLDLPEEPAQPTSELQRGATTVSGAVAPILPTPTKTRHVIVFLAANPESTSRLALDEECAAIERELRMTTGRDDFDFRSKWAVSVDEMMRHLNELQPTVIHFSGHGGGSAGIYLQDEERQAQQVTPHALTQMIGSAAPSARIVVLNACFSDAQAEPLRSVVDCVVGMRGAIGAAAARSFAVGFYRALGHRRSVGNAVAQAVATLAAKQLSDVHIPICRTRDGVNADLAFLEST